MVPDTLDFSLPRLLATYASELVDFWFTVGSSFGVMGFVVHHIKQGSSVFENIDTTAIGHQNCTPLMLAQ